MCGEFPTDSVLVSPLSDDESLACRPCRRGPRLPWSRPGGRADASPLHPLRIRAQAHHRRPSPARQGGEAPCSRLTVSDLQGPHRLRQAAEAEMHATPSRKCWGRTARRLSPPENAAPHSRAAWGRCASGSASVCASARTDHLPRPPSRRGKDAAGQPIGVVTTCEDISGAQAGGAELRRSEERLRPRRPRTQRRPVDWASLRTACTTHLAGKAMLGLREDEVATGRRNGWTASTRRSASPA